MKTKITVTTNAVPQRKYSWEEMNAEKGIYKPTDQSALSCSVETRRFISQGGIYGVMMIAADCNGIYADLAGRGWEKSQFVKVNETITVEFVG